MRRTCFAFFLVVLVASPAWAPLINRAVNPGVENGIDPWVLDVHASRGTFLVQIAGLLLTPSEGSSFFYTDRTRSSDGGTSSGGAYQIIDVRGLGRIEAVSYGGDLAHFADVISGSGQVSALPTAFVDFQDENQQSIGFDSGFEPAVNVANTFVAFDDLRYLADEVPAGTAFIGFGLGDNIRLVSDPGMQLEARFVTRIDDAYLGVVLPEAGSAAGGVAMAALALIGAARGNAAPRN